MPPDRHKYGCYAVFPQPACLGWCNKSAVGGEWNSHGVAAPNIYNFPTSLSSPEIPYAITFLNTITMLCFTSLKAMAGVSKAVWVTLESPSHKPQRENGGLGFPRSLPAQHVFHPRTLLASPQYRFPRQTYHLGHPLVLSRLREFQGPTSRWAVNFTTSGWASLAVHIYFCTAPNLRNGIGPQVAQSAWGRWNRQRCNRILSLTQTQNRIID